MFLYIATVAETRFSTFDSSDESHYMETGLNEKVKLHNAYMTSDGETGLSYQANRELVNSFRILGVRGINS